MGKTIKLRRGFDIKLEGGAVKILGGSPKVSTYAVKPADFQGIKPKLLVKVGDEVKAGTPLFIDKMNEQALFTAPVSGEVVDIKRGAKRKLLEITILADQEVHFADLGTKADPATLGKEEILESLLKSGAWPFIRKRPFAKIANPNENPKSIMISGFDSAPLSADLNFVMQGNADLFQIGIDVLSKLTTGAIHLNVRGEDTLCDTFKFAKGVAINKFYGPHPSGTIGVQIHHLDPIKKGDVVWYINPQDVLTIARVFTEGRFNAKRTIAVSGAEIKVRKYYQTYLGASIKPFLDNNFIENGFTKRIISGTPIFGQKIELEGFVGFYDNSVCVIQEGDRPEFQGFVLPTFKRPTASSAFPWVVEPDTKFIANTNTHGEERAFIVTGEYEKVLPMDLYPVYLLKAIMARDIEQMEGLGIYEVGEEEMAICEFACTSKIPVTDIIRQGLELIEKEG